MSEGRKRKAGAASSYLVGVVFGESDDLSESAILLKDEDDGVQSDGVQHVLNDDAKHRRGTVPSSLAVAATTAAPTASHRLGCLNGRLGGGVGVRMNAARLQLLER